MISLGKKKERAKALFKDKEFKETKRYSKRYAATVLSVVSAVLCVLTVVGIFVFREVLADPEVFRGWINENYLLGVIAVILICAVQVIVALIPGEAVEIACGYAFGTWMGALVCSIGILLGSITVILLVRKFGRKFVESLYPREKIDSLPILNDPKKRNLLTCLLFLIPGTPKDLLTYIIGLTEMSIPLYILLTTASRFPSVIMSTMGGDAFGDGSLVKALVVLAVAALISGSGYLAYIIIQKKSKSRVEKEGSDDTLK